MFRSDGIPMDDEDAGVVGLVVEAQNVAAVFRRQGTLEGEHVGQEDGDLERDRGAHVVVR